MLTGNSFDEKKVARNEKRKKLHGFHMIKIWQKMKSGISSKNIFFKYVTKIVLLQMTSDDMSHILSRLAGPSLFNFGKLLCCN